MKKLLLLVLLFISINTFATTYAGVASTENYYGNNYSVNIRIEGSCLGQYCSITSVAYYDGRSWRTAYASPVYGKQGKWSIYVEGAYYYFWF